MNDTVKPTIEQDKLGINPFLSNLKIPVHAVKMAGQYKKDKDGILLPLEVDLESDSSCRVYVDASRRRQMITLSARSKDLLLWVIYETDAGKEWIWVNYKRYMSECNVSSYNTYKKAIRDLVGKNFIQMTIVQHVYWINPHLFFNGSRVNRFPENVIKK